MCDVVARPNGDDRVRATTLLCLCAISWLVWFYPTLIALFGKVAPSSGQTVWNLYHWVLGQPFRRSEFQSSIVWAAEFVVGAGRFISLPVAVAASGALIVTWSTHRTDVEYVGQRQN